MKLSDMKKREQQRIRPVILSSKTKKYQDWLLLSFISIVIILLVFVISR